jgi:hypothetical protein
MSQPLYLRAVLTPLYSVYVPHFKNEVARAYHQEDCWDGHQVVMTESTEGLCWPTSAVSAIGQARSYMRRNQKPQTAKPAFRYECLCHICWKQFELEHEHAAHICPKCMANALTEQAA